jgi:hypothetical protein
MVRVFAITLVSPTITCIMLLATLPGATSISGRTILTDPEFSYPVTILWGAGAENETQWNDISVWCIETFGLPGNRYVTDISTEHMTWFFKRAQDAVFMKLKFGILAHNYDFR